MFPAAAQRFFITESQLQTLETLCQNYKVSNQNLQLQVNELMQTSESLKTDCETLKQKLETERQTVKTLNKFLKTYEISSSMIEAERDQLAQDLAEQKIKTQKARTVIIVLGSIIVFLVIAGAIGAYLLIKFK